MVAIDKNALARADPARGTARATHESAGPRWGMSWAAVFLTSRSLWILVRCMRRVLRVRAAFEPTRSTQEPLQFAYECAVPMVRRACGHADNVPPVDNAPVDNVTLVAARAHGWRRSLAGKAMP